MYLELANRNDGGGLAWLSFNRWLAVSGVASGPEFCGVADGSPVQIDDCPNGLLSSTDA